MTRFHRPGLHKKINRPSCPRGGCVDSHPCVARIPELLGCPCTEQSSQGEQMHILLHWSLVALCPRKLHQTSSINADSPKLRQTIFCFLEDACTRYHVFFDRTLDPNCNSRVAATIFDFSILISTGHHH